MSKKSIFLWLIMALAIIPIGIYLGQVVSAIGPPPLSEQAECLKETSGQLMAQHLQRVSPPFAVYLASPQATSAQIFDANTLAKNNIERLASSEELKQRVTHAPRPAAIYLHRDVLNRVDNAWLSQQYEAGIAIVGLNTLVSELGDRLGVKAGIEDLRLEYARGRPFVALFHKYSVDDGEGWGEYADFIGDPRRIPEIVNSSIDTYHASDEYLTTLKDTCLKEGD